MSYELMPAFKVMDYFRKDLNSYKPKSMRDVNDAIIVSARKGFDHTIITVDKEGFYENKNCRIISRENRRI